MAETPSRKRPLTAEEAELWAYAMREAKGLRGRRAGDAMPEPPVKPQKAPPAQPGAPAAPAHATGAVPPPSRPAAPAERLPPLARFDDRERRKLSRDADLIDARLDLHGMRQREAHGALTGFLLSCVARGHRHVLVITGKGGAPDLSGGAGRDFYFEERGVLKRLVPQWLSEPDLRRLVISYTAAGIRHGGEGALYVRLRKTPARP